MEYSHFPSSSTRIESPNQGASTQALVSGLLRKITALNHRMALDNPPAHSASPDIASSLRPSPLATTRNAGTAQTFGASEGEYGRGHLPPTSETSAQPLGLPHFLDSIFEDPSIHWIDRMHLTPAVAHRLESQLREWHGDWPPPHPNNEARLMRSHLSEQWERSRFSGDLSPQREILIGPAGAGKTTFLGKWLAHAVLAEHKRGRVWRLNGSAANTAESLSVLCQGLHVPVGRSWSDKNEPVAPGEAQFIDLPGVDWRDESALQEFEIILRTLPLGRVHLVLNAAYDAEILLRQAAAFLRFSPVSLILTHFDEEPNRLKSWNFLLGTKLAISFLSAGQNVPGSFARARLEMLLPLASG